MKQKQFSPLSVAMMGIIPYAANEGYLDDVEVKKVVDFEASLISYMNAEQQSLLGKIGAEGNFNDDIANAIKAAIEKFKATQTW